VFVSDRHFWDDLPADELDGVIFAKDAGVDHRVVALDGESEWAWCNHGITGVGVILKNTTAFE
jgi:hypothetical protein